MVAELLSVGTELLLGEVIDTNSAFLAQDLANRGVDVLWSQRVGDNQTRIAATLKSALARSDLIVLSGGLGPTEDDLTREAVAAVVSEVPKIADGLERTLRERFRSRNVTMPENNLKQAWLIPSAEALPNANGTAAGWFVRTTYKGNPRIIITLPGPPIELQPMWLQEALPRLQLPPGTLYRKTLKTCGLGESSVAERLGALTQGANPSVATYAKKDGVHVRVAAKAARQEDAAALAKPALEQVRQRLEPHIWGEDDEELPGVILGLLRAKGARVATAESLTGGLLGAAFAAIPGASAAYEGGVITYNSQQKAAFGVPVAILEAHGSVSAETAQALAQEAAHTFASDYGLSLTGVAGPEMLEGKLVGEVFSAVYRAKDDTARVLHHNIRNASRNQVRERATLAVLVSFWQVLMREGEA